MRVQGNIIEMIPDEFRESPAYQGTLSTDTVTIATFRDAGYHTTAGKWHLGHSPELLPSARGFDRTTALADSGADNWEQNLSANIRANWFADGERFNLPDDFYSSRFLVDKIIEFIDSKPSSEAPFFAYLPFQAVHIPVQAPQSFIDRYKGVYDDGWEGYALNDMAAQALGLVPENTPLNPWPAPNHGKTLNRRPSVTKPNVRRSMLPW